MAHEAPRQITLKRKLAEEQSEAPDVLCTLCSMDCRILAFGCLTCPPTADAYIDLKGPKPNIFRRVLISRPSSSKRRNVSSNALAREPASNTAPLSGAAAAAAVAAADVEGRSRMSDPGEGTRQPPDDVNAQRYYLSKGRRAFATFEAKTEVPSDVQTFSTTGQSSPRKKPSSSTRLSQREAHGRRPDGSEEAQTARPVAYAAAPNSIFQSMLEETELPSKIHLSDTLPERKRGVPRAPAVRMKDKLSPPPTNNPDAMDVDEADEVNYVYETYVLDVETVDFDFATAAPGTVGILMINEEDQPRWEAYLDWEEPDSDEFQNSDEDDENAENYYAADYPEDEVDFDDEHDVDPYKYTNRDAFDDELDDDEGNYSDGEAARSDDEDHTNKSHPWTRHWNRD